MSIRWKLFTALFVLTTVAIFLVLLVAEREFHRWIEGEVRLRFEAQVDGLLEARKERLAGVRETCTRLAEHPAIKAELKGVGTESLRTGFMAQLVEPRADAARQGGEGKEGSGAGGLRQEGRQRARGDASGLPGPARAIPTVGVIGLDGMPKPLGGLMRRDPARRRVSPYLGTVPESVRQKVAYVVLTHEKSGRSAVQEVVLTRVVDDDGSALGWFFLGRDAETPVERAFHQAERTSGRDGNSGLVAEGQWFVRGISEDQAAALNTRLGERFWTSGEPETVELGGRTLLAMARDLNPDSPVGKGYQVAFFPVTGLIEAIARLHGVVLWIGAGAALVTSSIAFLMARRFSRPIAELVAGTERIRKGDLEGQVAVRSRDELGVLAMAFNTMTRDLALKERYREVLSKTSDPSVAQQLVEGRLELGGEVRHAAVLFCDIRGFTAMTEGMPPAEVIGFVNEHMTALTRVVYLHGGVVDKFVGDLIMAVFGAPHSHADDAARAARCALEMIRVRRELNSSGGRVVEVGIGIAHGELVAGCMGSDDRLNYTVLGDRVNLASRLCGAAAAGEVLVDEAVAACLDETMEAEPRDPVLLKGFSEPVASFAIRKRH